MRKLYLIIFACLMLGSPVTVMALEQPEYGGNKASDYHPPTRNPQEGVLSGLQPNSNTNLQPTDVGIDPQNLMRTDNLIVLTSPDKGATSTSSQTIPEKPNKAIGNLAAWITGGILVLIALVYFLRRPVPRAINPEPAVVDPPLASPVSAKTKNPATKNKKTSRKKRKNTRR